MFLFISLICVSVYVKAGFGFSGDSYFCAFVIFETRILFSPLRLLPSGNGHSEGYLDRWMAHNGSRS
uniref:Putative secreted protein n=1 Tax=Anopheles triannulatus TaxID=58253 RepID=A0A2M4B153_9DIPT